MRIAVDVDNTLTQGEKEYWHEECLPDREMISQVVEKYNEGHTIIIWTARPWKNAPDLSAWLQKHRVKYHGIVMDKGSADMYVDDKAVTPEEFKG